eukprot:2880084-Alexandrium_andersonii.AAC.1
MPDGGCCCSCGCGCGCGCSAGSVHEPPGLFAWSYILAYRSPGCPHSIALESRFRNHVARVHIRVVGSR